MKNYSNLGLFKSKGRLIFEPHLLQVGDLDELLPYEFPQSHLRNCHSSLTNIANNAGSSLCRGKDEHLGPSKVAHNECN